MGGAARLEKRCDCQEAVDVFECAGVIGLVEEGGHECEDAGGEDGRAVGGIEKVEEELGLSLDLH